MSIKARGRNRDRWGGVWLGMGLLLAAGAPSKAEGLGPAVVSLDGPGWLLATDPRNVGRDEKWWEQPRTEAKPTHVPWIIQDPFPGYHGVAWYWREMLVPTNARPRGRHLLRFWAVDYKADVWVNGQPVGGHEGGETPFVLDVTGAVKPGETNRLAVRVLNPTHEPIDGIVLLETPHRNKALPYSPGNAWNQGGIIDSVELLLAPAVRVEDLFVRPDWKTGTLRVQANLRNTAAEPVKVGLEVAVAPAASGETLLRTRAPVELAPGDALWETQLTVPNHRLWELNDPFLYRVTVRLTSGGESSADEWSTRCGFRDFRFEDGYFRLNGRRIYLRCSHTGNCCPVGLELPMDPDFLRRDLLNVKVMGFNAIRYIAGVAKRYQLDLCDELGLLVYEESYAGWCLNHSAKMAERYDESVLGMVRRDRNHPSVALWGLLNETPDGPVFRHAVACLPRLRALDDTRLVLLNSGRWDLPSGSSLKGLQSWRSPTGPDPNVTHNPLPRPLAAPWATWAPGRMAFHPGPAGEYSVVRWTAPDAGETEIVARFFGMESEPTTDTHVLHNGRAVFDGFVNVRGAGDLTTYTGLVSVARGDTVDFVVGVGNGQYGGDTTGLEASLRRRGAVVADAAADFTLTQAAGQAWAYGVLAAGPKPETATFRPYTIAETAGATPGLGSFSNPGSTHWEAGLNDQHPYQRVPHTAEIVRRLRTVGGGGAVFISEYGIGSAVDLVRAARHYEQLGKTEAEDARFYRQQLDRFQADWERWRMAEAFGRMEDFFAAGLRRMAGQRLLGLNAIRSNPDGVGYSLTGTVDQGMSGEGLFTTFRELKPGTVDAVFDGFAPLRWCLFVEPAHVYRGTRVELEAVLANEDALPPGSYPARFAVFGPAQRLVWSVTTNVTIAATRPGAEPPFAVPVLRTELPVDGPVGAYRFVAAFERGGAAAGGEAEFHVAERALGPPLETEIVVWGEDAGLLGWLHEHGVRGRNFDGKWQTEREVILAAGRPPAPGGAEVFAELARRIEGGATAVFLSMSVFAEKNQPTAWVPLQQKGTLAGLPSWLYHKDEWAKPHPIFEGLPTGLLDYTFYRELIPDVAWVGLETPAEVVAGANDASIGYSAGLLVSVHTVGQGRIVLNTLTLREHLGRHPAADRLLWNMLRYAGR